MKIATIAWLIISILALAWTTMRLADSYVSMKHEYQQPMLPDGNDAEGPFKDIALGHLNRTINVL